MNRPLSEELRKITDPVTIFGIPVKIWTERLPKDMINECIILVGKPKAKNPLISRRLKVLDGMSLNVIYTYKESIFIWLSVRYDDWTLWTRQWTMGLIEARVSIIWASLAFLWERFSPLFSRCDELIYPAVRRPRREAEHPHHVVPRLSTRGAVAILPLFSLSTFTLLPVLIVRSATGPYPECR